MLVGGVSGPRNFRPLRPSKSSGRLPSASDTCSRFWLPLANGVKTGWSFDVVAKALWIQPGWRSRRFGALLAAACGKTTAVVVKTPKNKRG